MEAARKIKIHTFVAHGTQDEIIPAAQSYALVDALEDVEFLTLPKSGHIVQDDPEMWKALEAYLKRQIPKWEPPN